MCLQFHNTDTFSLPPYPFSSLSRRMEGEVLSTRACVTSKNNSVCAVEIGVFASLSSAKHKSFKSMLGGFKSYFVSDTHPLIAQPRPSTATHASTGVPRLPVLAMCPWEGVKSAATSGVPKTRRLRARRLMLSPSRLPSMQWEHNRTRLTPVPL